jgi:hypothetical protein
MTKKINISVLNLVPVREGSNATGAFEDMITWPSTWTVQVISATGYRSIIIWYPSLPVRHAS